MSLYRVFLSSGDVLEQDAPSSKYLYKCVRFRFRIEPTEYQSAVCCRVTAYGLDIQQWVMTHDPFDGLRISKWQEDKAHRAVARQIFLFNGADKWYTKEWLNDRLFEMSAPGHKLFVLED